ncbi:MAG: MucBP domain-containing protein, partial [Atopobiaceae bacterium]|nr:MucBP domain-containing protein [Atopobiaceae bacterium]
MKQSTKYLRYITGVLVVAFVVAMAAFPAKAIAEDDYDTTVELQALSEQSAPDVQMQALEAQAAEPSAPYDTAIQEQASTQTTVVQFVDEDGKSLGNITGYGSEGTKYTTKGKGKQSLVDLVNNKISDLAKRHYEVKSSNFDQNGSYKATNETCTIVMKAINGAGTEQTIVVKFVDRYTQTTINVPTGKEGVLSVGEVRLTGTAGYTVSESGMESINEMKDKIVAAGYTLVSMGQVNANLTFDFDVNSDQSYYVTFQGHITSVQNPQDVIYTGTALKPSPLVKQNNLELTPGKDYSLSYSNT